MQQAEIIDYLKIKTGGLLVMTPQQLEQEIGISTKQQSVLRNQKRFPIPHKQMGRSVLYSIIHIADFLIDGEVYTAPNKKYEPKPAPKISRSKSSQDLSHLFILRTFTTNLETQANQLLELSKTLAAFAKSKDLYDSLRNKLTPNSMIYSPGDKI